MNTVKNIYVVPQAIVVDCNNHVVLMAGSPEAGQVTQDDDSKPAKSFQPICDDKLGGIWEEDNEDKEGSSSFGKSRLW